jgi:ARG/rhodanese/phosphatase superfamily protein
MKKSTFAILMAFITFVVGVGLARISFIQHPTQRIKTELNAGNYRLTGPYQYENLTIFLVHGPDQPGARIFTPLQEAMERNQVIVHETSEVNELAIENISNSEVFVQSGDIVKGGRQDRVLAVDLILSAKSGEIPISAFCVEHGRWTQRGAEPAAVFDKSDQMIATKRLKLAARQELSQAHVWNEVEATQGKLSYSVSGFARSTESESSLQLALENEGVQKLVRVYMDKLSSIVEGHSDVIGFVFAINDQLNSGDVYSSQALFKRFWPRLLRTAATEAVVERQTNEKRQPVSIASTADFLISSERGTETIDEVTKRTHMLKRDGEKTVFFETRDMDQKGQWVHRNYLMK